MVEDWYVKPYFSGAIALERGKSLKSVINNHNIAISKKIIPAKAKTSDAVKNTVIAPPKNDPSGIATAEALSITERALARKCSGIILCSVLIRTTLVTPIGSHANPKATTLSQLNGIIIDTNQNNAVKK